MLSNEIKFNSQNDIPGISESGAAQSAHVNGVGSIPSANWDSMLQALDCESGLSQDGQDYIEKLSVWLDEFSAKHTSMKAIKIQKMNKPVGTYVVSSGEDYYILVMSEANSNTAIPAVDVGVEAINNYNAYNNTQILASQIVVIAPADYSKVKVMGAFLGNQFIVAKNPQYQAATMATLANNMWGYSLNPNEYDAFVQRTDPHGVPARADLKCVLYTTTKRNTNIFDANQFGAAPQYDRTDVLAIGAYVDFVAAHNNQGGTIFVPEIHISSIVTNVPWAGLLPVAISVATNIFLDGGAWKNQFQDLVDSKANIGNLIIGEDQKPWNATSQQSLNEFYSTYVKDAIIVIDNQYGRAQPAGMYELTNTSDAAQDRVLSELGRIFGNPYFTSSMTAKFVQPYYTEFTGYAQIGAANKVDSRNFDYLNMVKVLAANGLALAPMLTHFRNPADKAIFVKEKSGLDVEMLYTCNVTFINVTLLRQIMQSASSILKLQSYGQANAQISPTVALNYSQEFANSAANTASFVQQGNFTSFAGYCK